MGLPTSRLGLGEVAPWGLSDRAGGCGSIRASEWVHFSLLLAQIMGGRGWILVLTHWIVASIGTVEIPAEFERFRIIFLVHLPRNLRQGGVNYGKSVATRSSHA